MLAQLTTSLICISCLFSSLSSADFVEDWNSLAHPSPKSVLYLTTKWSSKELLECVKYDLPDLDDCQRAERFEKCVVSCLQHTPSNSSYLQVVDTAHSVSRVWTSTSDQQCDQNYLTMQADLWLALASVLVLLIILAALFKLYQHASESKSHNSLVFTKHDNRCLNLVSLEQ